MNWSLQLLEAADLHPVFHAIFMRIGKREQCWNDSFGCFIISNPPSEAQRARVCASSCILSLSGGGERSQRCAQSYCNVRSVFFSFFFCPDATVCNPIVTLRNVSECFPV